MVWPTPDNDDSAPGGGAASPDPERAAGVVGAPGSSATAPAASVRPAPPPPAPLIHGRMWILLAALYLVVAAQAARLFTTHVPSDQFFWYVGLIAAYLALLTLVWFRPRMPVLLLHVVFAAQCAVVLWLVLLDPDRDYMTALYVPLAYQAAAVFSGRVRWFWVGAILVLIAVPLTLELGLRGLGLALTPMAASIALAAMAAAGRDVESARAASHRLVADLEETHGRLERYAAEVESLAAVEERNRLVRELHDSVSQAMFAILLATSSARMMLETDPPGARAQLERLRDLTRDALARMREFITELRQAAR